MATIKWQPMQSLESKCDALGLHTVLMKSDGDHWKSTYPSPANGVGYPPAAAKGQRCLLVTTNRLSTSHIQVYMFSMLKSVGEEWDCVWLVGAFEEPEHVQLSVHAPRGLGVVNTLHNFNYVCTYRESTDASVVGPVLFFCSTVLHSTRVDAWSICCFQLFEWSFKASICQILGPISHPSTFLIDFTLLSPNTVVLHSILFSYPVPSASYPPFPFYAPPSRAELNGDELMRAQQLLLRASELFRIHCNGGQEFLRLGWACTVLYRTEGTSGHQPLCCDQFVDVAPFPRFSSPIFPTPASPHSLFSLP
ncbi:hypothetical protein B0H17DRAFT_1135538 [Mycena rosella]|uniref:Uncharacterized protein n=1 Tax=Mycena rosella TaxID=1033263 RepID=A0AAD7GHQ7_MYCRO|nr:hypothetical protein B0H17DRAFT_1135538 [Mycena rosella]